MGDTTYRFLLNQVEVTISRVNPPKRHAVVIDYEDRVVPKGQCLGCHVAIKMTNDDSVSELVTAFIAVVQLGPVASWLRWRGFSYQFLSAQTTSAFTRGQSQVKVRTPCIVLVSLTLFAVYTHTATSRSAIRRNIFFRPGL